MPLRALLFDLDGTLTEPRLDFDAIRREAHVPDRIPILEYMQGLPPSEAAGVNAILHHHEEQAALESELAPGAREIFDLAGRLGLRLAIITRNSRRSVETFIERHALAVDVEIAREDAEVKPSPEPVLAACRSLEVSPGEALMVGDYVFDMQSGRAAGAMTAFLRHTHTLPEDFKEDYVLETLYDLAEVVKELTGGAS